MEATAKYKKAVDDLDLHWVEYSSYKGKDFGYRLFQNDPKDVNDFYMQIRCYTLNTFNKRNALVVGKTTMNLREAFQLLYP